MKPEDKIKQFVRQLSESIFRIKAEAPSAGFPSICPQHPRWNEYRGKKQEATKWLVALHLCRGSRDKVCCHTASEQVVNSAWKAIGELSEKLRKESVGA